MTRTLARVLSMAVLVTAMLFVAVSVALRGMAARLGAVRGSLEVTSAPGAGTTIVGRIPVGPS